MWLLKRGRQPSSYTLVISPDAGMNRSGGGTGDQCDTGSNRCQKRHRHGLGCPLPRNRRSKDVIS